MGSHGQIQAYRAGRRVPRSTPRPWPPSLAPLLDKFGADVVLLGGLSSGTETPRGQAALKVASRVFLPLGRQRMPDGQWPLFGHQVCYLGPAADAFVSAVSALPDPRRPLLTVPGLIWREKGLNGKRQVRRAALHEPRVHHERG